MRPRLERNKRLSLSSLGRTVEKHITRINPYGFPEKGCGGKAFFGHKERFSPASFFSPYHCQRFSTSTS